MKTIKKRVKYQLKRDGELYGIVYNHRYEAVTDGDLLVNCKMITKYEVVPVTAVWLHCK